MSRASRVPIKIPDGVEVVVGRVAVSGAFEVKVKGVCGFLSLVCHPWVNLTSREDGLHISSENTSTKAKALLGTFRQLIANMISDVSKEFEKRLILSGVGYRAQVQNGLLNLMVGYSHAVNMPMPSGVSVFSASPNEIIIKGVNRQKVGQTAAQIRAVRPPELYKGKGIRYDYERIVIKQTKKK